MIHLYTWKTPNGRKPAIMLEETGLPYRAIPVDISADAQFAPAFLAIAPNNKIPAIVDDGDGRDQPVFESGAILTYLAERTGTLLPASGPARWAAMEWLHWSIGGLGPMLGQLGYFALRAQEKTPPAIDRFRTECERLFGVLENRLKTARFVGGAKYSIADIVSYPWLAAAKEKMAEPLERAFASAPAIAAWMAQLAERPAVQKGMRVLED